MDSHSGDIDSKITSGAEPPNRLNSPWAAHELKCANIKVVISANVYQLVLICANWC